MRSVLRLGSVSVKTTAHHLQVVLFDAEVEEGAPAPAHPMVVAALAVVEEGELAADFEAAIDPATKGQFLFFPTSFLLASCLCAYVFLCVYIL